MHLAHAVACVKKHGLPSAAIAHTHIRHCAQCAEYLGDAALCGASIPRVLHRQHLVFTVAAAAASAWLLFKLAVNHGHAPSAVPPNDANRADIPPMAPCRSLGDVRLHQYSGVEAAAHRFAHQPVHGAALHQPAHVSPTLQILAVLVAHAAENV